jgi:hypothetical protein
MNVFDLQLALQGVDPNLPIYRKNVDFESGEDDWVVKNVVVRPIDEGYPTALVIE